jgi:hypothetical protein
MQAIHNFMYRTNLYMKLSEYLQNEPVKIYYIVIGILYTGYILTFLGIYYANPEYIQQLNIFIRVFVSVVLLVRFNPFNEVVVSKSDRILISAAAFFLLITTGVNDSVCARGNERSACLNKIEKIFYKTYIVENHGINQTTNPAREAKPESREYTRHSEIIGAKQWD